ncbi:RNA polymerase factor sigma-54 [Alkalibacter saccharofermentans]|uniref:RNA polymerase, sigma 54 subunit, RpoN/SigL n=1 Tax=Alkalibacter saccharofermentans DSM 14828 TaxID=1120975 RepID=A0A1M4V122_9FIRM|nr:RNA polymerase factor sigma-54 [Alkalibacter saccharofermentans]SHE62676.1 RNA polymerase, sigma 54 subunit, RpoN/SigL [Alkalibacter saccharofermentans DSM 14828]
MKLGFDLSLKQKQKLIMTNQLIQGINILQYNTIELGEYINQEMEKNPLLEKEETSVDAGEGEVNWLEFVKNTNKTHEHSQPYSDDEEKNVIENVKCMEESLKEILIGQLHVLNLSEEDYGVGEFIIDFIDERGYLSAEPEEMAQMIKVPVTKVIKLVNLIRRFEPSGVGGRNLRECLKIQLINMNHFDDMLFHIIDEHLEDIGYNRDQKLMKELDLDKEDISYYRELLKSLDPKPGLKYCEEEPDYVIPDIFVEVIDDKVSVTMNDHYVPRLKINSYYQSLLQKGGDEKTTEFIKSGLNSASFVINSILQRKETVKNIAQLLFEKQVDFLRSGEGYIKPMTLKEIAEVLEIHESTVSRAIKNKYAVTPRGIYSLKHFFTTGLASQEGEDVSAVKIKDIIKDLISKENKKKPYSDQNITDILKEKGYTISRRTVAKYRENLNILSTRERKEA